MMKILLVDDDRSLADLVQYGLMREGFDVLMAHSGQEALHVIRATPVDLVMLDVNLPDQSGFAVLAALREVSDAPVMMLTGSARGETGAAASLPQPDDYLVKPFSMQMLVNRIRGLLHGRANAGQAAG